MQIVHLYIIWWRKGCGWKLQQTLPGSEEEQKTGWKGFQLEKENIITPLCLFFVNQSFYILPLLKDFYFDYINRVSKLDQIG